MLIMHTAGSHDWLYWDLSRGRECLRRPRHRGACDDTGSPTSEWTMRLCTNEDGRSAVARWTSTRTVLEHKCSGVTSTDRKSCQPEDSK